MLKPRIAIRDDDLSFWSDPAEIERAYGKLFDDGIKVSFAVVPCAVRSYFRGVPEKYYMEYNSERAVSENEALMEYMRELIRAGKAEIMLHGYNHTYGYFLVDGSIGFPYKNEIRSVGTRWAPECIHKSMHRMLDEIARGRAYLERVFECPVTVFVPPGNAIGKVVRNLSMDICSSTPTLLDRGVRKGLPVWLRQKLFRLFNGYPFPGVTLAGGHRETTALSLATGADMEFLIKVIASHFSNDFPAIIATHHWEIAVDTALHERLQHVVQYATSMGGECVLVSEIHNSRESHD